MFGRSVFYTFLFVAIFLHLYGSGAATGTETTSCTAAESTCQLVSAMNQLNQQLQDQAQPQLTTVQVNEKLSAALSANENTNKGEKTTVSFILVVTEPPLAMGTLAVNTSYNPTRAPADTEVSVKIEVLGVTSIDSEQKTAGLHMALTLAWQDPRIMFTQRQPNVNEEFEYDPALLK